MLQNLAGLKYITLAEDNDHVEMHESIKKLLAFRSIDPLYGAYVAEQLNRAERS